MHLILRTSVSKPLRVHEIIFGGLIDVPGRMGIAFLPVPTTTISPSTARILLGRPVIVGIWFPTND